ncbi:MAG TPA: D-glycerate dehydrogenase [Oleiagrimonas sp.]|nr:D-glycerate dehydrogenase [Oleiagrimonas sp.]
MSSKPALWISRPTFDDVIAPLAEHFDVRAETVERNFSSDEIRQRLADCDAAIVGMKEHIGTREVQDAARLRMVANFSVGYDNLDVAALTAAGIAASNTAGSLNDSVADFAWALILAAARRLGEAERWVRAGQWQHPAQFLDWLGTDVFGGTLGILGMGRIGQAVARRATGFRMPVIYHNRSRLDAATERDCAARYVDKATLLREADVLVVVVPLTDATRHIIGADELTAMKSTAVLVNVARGGVVDDVALAQALAVKRIAAAGLDVFDGEPVLNPALLDLDNVVLAPHVASATTGTRRAMAATAVDNVLAFFGHGVHAGQPPNLLNPEALTSGPHSST